MLCLQQKTAPKDGYTQQIKDMSQKVNRTVFHMNVKRIMQGSLKVKKKPTAQAAKLKAAPPEKELPVCVGSPTGR